jgi:hypothetical protein
MRITWYGKRERKLRSLNVDVPPAVLEGFLRAIQSPVAMESPLPAIRRRRRTRRKGKDCTKRRKLLRAGASGSLVRPEAEDVVESSADCGSCLAPGLLSDVGPGSCGAVCCLEPPPAETGGDLVTGDGGGSGDKLSPKAAEFRPAPALRFFNAPIRRFGPPPLPPGPEPVVAPSQPHGISISTDNSGSAADDDGVVYTAELEGQFDSEKVAKVAEVASGLSSELGHLDPVPAAAGQILQGAADVATGATGVGAAALPVVWVDGAEAALKGVRGQGRRTKRRLKRISRLAAENHWLVGRISKLVAHTRRWLAFRLGSVGSTPGLRERLYNSLFVSTEIVGSAELAVAVGVPAGALVSSSAAAAEAARAAAAAAEAAATCLRSAMVSVQDIVGETKRRRKKARRVQKLAVEKYLSFALARAWRIQQKVRAMALERAQRQSPVNPRVQPVLSPPSFHEQLVELMQQHCPEKVGNAGALLAQYTGSEELLLRKIRQKYTVVTPGEAAERLHRYELEIGFANMAAQEEILYAQSERRKLDLQWLEQTPSGHGSGKKKKAKKKKRK